MDPRALGTRNSALFSPDDNATGGDPTPPDESAQAAAAGPDPAAAGPAASETWPDDWSDEQVAQAEEIEGRLGKMTRAERVIAVQELSRAYNTLKAQPTRTKAEEDVADALKAAKPKPKPAATPATGADDALLAEVREIKAKLKEREQSDADEQARKAHAAALKDFDAAVAATYAGDDQLKTVDRTLKADATGDDLTVEELHKALVDHEVARDNKKAGSVKRLSARHAERLTKFIRSVQNAQIEQAVEDAETTLSESNAGGGGGRGRKEPEQKVTANTLYDKAAMRKRK